MHPHHLAERIDGHLDAGRWETAARRLHQVLATTAPTSAWRAGWLARLGRCALATGAGAEARRYATRAESALMDPTNRADSDDAAGQDASLGVFVLLRDLGQMAAAERVLRHWIAGSTGVASADALTHLGDLLADRGDRRAAIEALQAAIIQAGDDDDRADQARLSLAVVLEECGRRAEARRHRDRALRALAARVGLDDPDYLLGLHAQAVSLLNAGRAHRAVPILRRAVRLAAPWERTDPALVATLQHSLADGLWDRGAPPGRWRPHRDAAVRLTSRAFGSESVACFQARCWAASFEPPHQAFAELETVLSDSKRIISLPAHVRAEIVAVIGLKMHDLGRIPEALAHVHQALALLPLEDREEMPPDVYSIAMNTILGLLGILRDQVAHDPASRDQARHWLDQARGLAGDDVRFMADLEREADALAATDGEWDHAP